MKVVFQTYGTRGDVQPFVVLAHALAARGHNTVVAAPTDAKGFVERAGVRFASLEGSARAYFESPEGRRMLADGDVRGFMRYANRYSREINAGLNRDMLASAEGADVIVSHFLCEDRGAAIAEKLGVPQVLVHFAPVRSTREIPNALVTGRRLPGFLNRATHALFDQLWWRGLKDDIAGFRRDLGVPPVRGPGSKRFIAADTPTVMAYSRIFAARPKDWPSRCEVVGHLRVPSELRARMTEAPPAELAAWVEAGPPPLYLGFGSLPILDPAGTFDRLVKVTAELEQRAVIVAGWSGIERLGDHPHVRVVDAIDHDWLLPRSALAVHHGGSGTVHAVLAAGVPSLVASVFADQRFFGAGVVRMGAGLHVPFAKLEPKRLVKALGAILASDAMRERARAAAAELRDEGDGVGRAVEMVEAATKP